MNRVSPLPAFVSRTAHTFARETPQDVEYKSEKSNSDNGLETPGGLGPAGTMPSESRHSNVDE